MWGRAINPNPFYKGWFITLSSLKYSQIQKVFAAFCALLEQKPSLCKIFDLKARRFWTIFVLLGRRNALCLSRHNRAKSAEIGRFKAGSDLSFYPMHGYYYNEERKNVKSYFLDLELFSPGLS